MFRVGDDGGCCVFCLTATTTTTTTTVSALFKTIKKAAANLVHNYWHLHPVEIVHCAHVPCGVNRQYYGVLVLRLPV